MTKKKSTRPKERDIQTAWFKEIKALELIDPVWSLAAGYPFQGRGGKDSIIWGRMRQAEGARKGWPDIQFLVPRGGFHGLLIEVKRAGRKADKNQLRYLSLLKSQGYCVGVMATDDHREIVDFMKLYLAGGIKRK